MKETIILLMLSVFAFTGCLTVPGTPTARLIRKDSTEVEFSMPCSAYETTSITRNSGEPGSGGSEDTFIEGGAAAVNYDPPTLSIRSRFNFDDIEIGGGFLGVLYADAKYSPLPQNSLFLPALDLALYVDPASTSAGAGAGAILNIQPTGWFSLVTAAYLQYMLGTFNKLLNVESDNNTDGFYGYIPGANSYLYSGTEWYIGDSFIFDLGVGYMILSKNRTTFTCFGEEYNYYISNAFIVNYALKWLI